MGVLNLSPWVVMWLLAAILFLVAKWLTLRSATIKEYDWKRYLAYWLAWPGMDADAFLSSHVQEAKPSPREWFVAGGNITLGVALFWLVPPLPIDPLVRGWLGMMGVIFMLHFGIFNLLSCYWR